MFECVKVYQEHSPFWTIWMKSIFFIRCLMFDLYYPSLDIQKRERERGTIIKNIWTFVNHLFLPFFLTLSLIVINNNSKKKLNLLIVIQSFYVSGNLNLMMIMMKNKKKTNKKTTIFIWCNLHEPIVANVLGRNITCVWLPTNTTAFLSIVFVVVFYRLWIMMMTPKRSHNRQVSYVLKKKWNKKKRKKIMLLFLLHFE